MAEDEVLIRMDLAEMLTEEGYDVVGQAGDGATAVDLAEELRPDLVILAVKMPVLDGIAAAEQIASQRIAPVVILTAFSQRELVERARDAGAMAYLVKPFTQADLVPAIETTTNPTYGTNGNSTAYVGDTSKGIYVWGAQRDTIGVGVTSYIPTAGSTVTRSQDGKMAVEFETSLVADGAGGLCTRHRVSPYALAAAGMPLAALPEAQPPPAASGGGQTHRPHFLQLLAG